MVTHKDDFFSGMLLAPMLKLVIFLLFLKKYEVFGSNKGVTHYASENVADMLVQAGLYRVTVQASSNTPRNPSFIYANMITKGDYPNLGTPSGVFQFASRTVFT
jgi:hypothetical protein